MNRRDFIRVAGLSSLGVLGGTLNSGFSQDLEWKASEEVNSDFVPGFNIYACNSFVDFDSNGKLLVPQELIGVKNRFCFNEPISFVVHARVPGQVEKQFTLEVYDPSGNKCYSYKQFLTGKSLIIAQEDISRNLSNHGSGTFAIVGTLNGKRLGSLEFEISDLYESPARADFSVKGFDLFTCNHAKDIENNGVFEKSNFFGRKNQFNPSERVMLVGYSDMPKSAGKTLNLSVYNSFGKKLTNNSFYLDSDHVASFVSDISPKLSQVGNYTAVATLGQPNGGKLIGRHDFEVTSPSALPQHNTTIIYGSPVFIIR